MNVATVDGPKLADILQGLALKLEENKDYLCELDSEVGDGDHGVSMTIGMRAVRSNLAALSDATLEGAFRAVSEAFADEVGASIGPLYEAAFDAAADTVAGTDEIADAETWARVLDVMTRAMQKVGKAEPGDKTLIDAWLPAAEAAASGEGKGVSETLEAASTAAWAGVEKTKDLIPKRGRASRLGERARGYQDAGATSASILLEALYEGVAGVANH